MKLRRGFVAPAQKIVLPFTPQQTTHLVPWRHVGYQKGASGSGHTKALGPKQGTKSREVWKPITDSFVPFLTTS